MSLAVGRKVLHVTGHSSYGLYNRIAKILPLFLLIAGLVLFETARQQIKMVEMTSMVEQKSSMNSSSSLPFCRQLQKVSNNDDCHGNGHGHGHGSAAAVASWWWTESFDKILDASLFPKAIRKTDAEYEYQYDPSSATNKEFYRNMLLKAGTAFQLQDALLTHPTNEDFDRIYGILERRWLWFSSRNNKGNKDDDAQSAQSPPPPLKVVVMGGSATVGADCEQPVTMTRRRKKQPGNSTATSDDNDDSNHSDWEDYVHVIKRFECNWSVRLESFVNSMLGYDAIRVVNIGQGGTNTDHGSLLVKYQLSFPDDWDAEKRASDDFIPTATTIAAHPVTGPPDIIIHAYGTNDSGSPHGIKSEAQRIQYLHQTATTRLNGFIQTVKESFGGECQQHMPVLLFLDDYNGGFFRGSILGDRTYRMVLREISEWYSLMAVSSAKVIEQLVFPDVFGEQNDQNISFAPKGWEETYKTKKMNPHFPYTGHIAVVWSWAYSSLTSAVNYCNNLELQERQKQHQQISASNDDAKDKQQRTQEVLHSFQTPVLDYGLDLHNVSDALKQETNCRQDSSNNNNSSKGTARCAMAWIAYMNPLSTLQTLKANVNPFIGFKDGWNIEYDMSTGSPRKPGIVAKEKGATLQFDILDLSIPVKVLTIQYLRSYGEAWEGSEVLITVRRKRKLPHWTKTATKQLFGIHDSKTSITYESEIRFPDEIEIGSDVQVEIQLTGGMKLCFLMALPISLYETIDEMIRVKNDDKSEDSEYVDDDDDAKE